MPITFYDLCGKDGARFSPFGWRTRMALAHKGLDYALEPVRFTEKHKLEFSGQKLVPVIRDGDTTVFDSFAIAEYLERAYPDRPALFGGAHGMAKALNGFVDRTVQPLVGPMIVADVYDHVDDTCREYFRTTREQRFAKPMDQIQTGRVDRVIAFRTALEPIRAVVRGQPFVGGEAPNYGDFPLFGTLQWARLTSTFQLIEDDDPLHGWFERMLDAYDGLGRSAPAATTPAAA